MRFAILAEQGKGEWGKGKWSGVKAIWVRASGARANEARASKARLRGEEQEKSDQQRLPLSSSSSKLIQFFFPTVIAPFTGIFWVFIRL